MRYDDNLARRNEQYYRQSKPKKTNTNKKRGQKKAMLQKRNRFKGFVCVVAITLAAAFMITKFVAVKESAKQVQNLQSQLAEVQAFNSQKVFEVEQSIDLATVEKEATNRLGMQRPSKNQTIYVNVKSDDKTETTAQQAESISSRVSKWFDDVKNAVIDYFSIK